MGLFRAYFYFFITYFQLSFRTFVLPVSSVWTTIWHNQSAEKWEAEWINLESEVIRICDAQWSSNLLHSWNDGKLKNFQRLSLSPLFLNLVVETWMCAYVEVLVTTVGWFCAKRLKRTFCFEVLKRCVCVCVVWNKCWCFAERLDMHHKEIQSDITC